MSMTKQQVLQAFEQRAATRHYTDRKLSDDDLRFILECGRLSPSSVGSEPWQFVVLDNSEIREKIKPFAWGIKHPMDAMSHLIIILAKKNARYDSDFFRVSLAKRGLTEEQMAAAVARYKKFQTEDMKIADSERSLFDWASKQTYIALGNMMTAAAMVGIDSCPIEGFHYDEINRILAEEGVFDANEYGVSVMMTLGYRAVEPPAKYRKPFDEVVRWVK